MDQSTNASVEQTPKPALRQHPAIARGWETGSTELAVLSMASMLDDRLQELTAAVLSLKAADTVPDLYHALREFIDDEPCRLDHEGYCQTHYVTNPCIVVKAKNAMAKAEGRS